MDYKDKRGLFSRTPHTPPAAPPNPSSHSPPHKSGGTKDSEKRRKEYGSPASFSSDQA